jgi:uncharacterized protein YuzE
MKTHYDLEVNALYISFAEAEIVEREEVFDGVTFDFDNEGRIVSLEILHASKHIAPGATFSSA